MTANTFPSLCENLQSTFSCIGIGIAIELTACLESHPRIHARHYPIHYIALLLWQDDGEAMLDAIAQETFPWCQVQDVARPA